MSTCLQMGHVPRTRGSTGAPGEQAYNRAVTAEATALLRSMGEVVIVIGADAGVPRTSTFVAVHYDGSVNPSARGASVGYRPGRSTTPGSRALAHLWKAAYVRLGFPGGFRGDNYTTGLSGYYGTGRAHAAGTPRAFILEGGFGSHPVEGPWLRSRAGIVTCARAIVAALTGRSVGSSPEAPIEEDDDMRYDEGKDKPSQRVKDWQHALSLFMYLSGGGYDGGGLAHDRNGSHLEVDGHLGPQTADAGQHAITRVQMRLVARGESPRSLYGDPRNPSATFVAYVIAENVRALADARS